MPLRRIVPPPPYARIKTGTYTGDGAASQAITGVGFQPTFVIVLERVDNRYGILTKTDKDGVNAHAFASDGTYMWADYDDDLLISLDSDGFTVGDGTAAQMGNEFNYSGREYTFIAYG